MLIDIIYDTRDSGRPPLETLRLRPQKSSSPVQKYLYLSDVTTLFIFRVLNNTRTLAHSRSLEEEVSKNVRRGLNTNQQEPGQIAMENILLLLKMHTPNLIYEGQSC